MLPTPTPIRSCSKSAEGQTANTAGSDPTIYRLAYSPDGRHLSAGNGDGIAYVWEAAGATPPLVLAGHQNKLTSLAFSPDSRRLATGGIDGEARLWDLTSSAPVATVLAGHTEQIAGLAFSPDGVLPGYRQL